MELRNSNCNLLLKTLFCMCFISMHRMHAISASIDDDPRTPGWTYPETVEIAIGDSMNISCFMKLSMFPGKSSNDLYFIDAHSEIIVPQTNISIINDSTIVYMLRDAEEQQKSFYCKIGGDAIMETKVYVGTPPKDVKDFACHSYDFEYMVCKFTQPHNPILTQYNLTYRTHSVDYSYDPLCNYDDKPMVLCNITMHQKYQPTTDKYYFQLKAINTLGTKSSDFLVNNLNNMIPARPGHDFKVVFNTSDMLNFSWKMPKYEMYKMRGLVWEIMWKPNGSNWTFVSQVPLVRARNELSLNLTDLPYAYYWYELRIRVKVRSSPYIERMWSEWFVYHFRTAAKRPDNSPLTDVASFYVNSMENEVRVYWEQLPKHAENGANFSYVISEVKKNGNKINLPPQVLANNSAVFAWHKDAHYDFGIKSRNHMGESLETSYIHVYPIPSKSAKSYAPRSIHNVYHSTNRSYTLTWEPPKESTTNLKDFTVFWCLKKRGLQNECEGSIHFKHLNKNVTKFKTEPPPNDKEHSLNLAVSANYFNFNTGMHWTACTREVNSELIKLEPEVQVKSSNSIQVRWSPESVCPSILDGYNLTYCEMQQQAYQSKCINKILDKNAKNYDLNNLKPFTNYTVEMYMFSRLKFGKPSDPIQGRTNEDAPSPPRQLQLTKLTNVSAKIAWYPPSDPNGLIRHYVVVMNNEKHIVKPNDDADAAAKIEFEPTNLTSNTAYKVYVLAHTVDSSLPSNDIHFTTLIGYPSVPLNVITITDTDNKTAIQWNKPMVAAGRLEFYEVAVIVKRKKQEERKRITAVFGMTTCEWSIPTCIDKDYETVVKVRAVNAALKSHEVSSDELYTSAWDEDAKYYQDNDDLNCISGRAQSENLKAYRNTSIYRLFKSPWQEGPTISCEPFRLGKITTIALMVIVLSLCIMVVFYMARKKYYKMAKIACILPPGLGPYSTKPGIDNAILDKSDASDQHHHRSKEFIFHNEKHHLLSSVGNDSGYLGNGRTLASSEVDGGMVVNDRHITNYLQSTSESSADSLVDSTGSTEPNINDIFTHLTMANISKVAAADEALTEAHANTHIQHILPVQNGYIKPTKMMNWQMSPPPSSTAESTINSPSDGYIAIGSIVVPPSVNGYVQPHSVQKNLHPTAALFGGTALTNTANDGYMTLDELGKQTTQPAQLQPAANANDNTLISGYVTQRDLTAFGQQRLA